VANDDIKQFEEVVQRVANHAREESAAQFEAFARWIDKADLGVLSDAERPGAEAARKVIASRAREIAEAFRAADGT